MQRSSGAWAAAVAALGLVAVAILRHSTRPRFAPFSLPERRRAAAQTKVFVLAVNLRFKSQEDQLAFLSIWRRLADYVRRAEPEALSFEMLRSDSDPMHLLVYERYVSRDAYQSVHRASGAFLEFKSAWAALPFQVEVSGQSFVEQNEGFMV